jgi:8-oxo-dGTP diphosphatase
MSRKEFHGCKVVLFKDDEILVYLRDDDPSIEAPNMWDLPGGGREGTESPEACVLRELYEEFGLSFFESRLLYKRKHEQIHLGRTAYFFVGNITEVEIDSIKFGNEGQYWKFMSTQEYLVHEQVPDRHKSQLNDYFEYCNR